jgi:hypothetical protein
MNRFRTNDSTAIRPEDVQFLENNVLAGGCATSIYRSVEAENWVEQNHDTALLKSIRSVGLGGPLATMVSLDMPALAIFGSALDDRVLELAKTLSEVSTFAVMVRSAADDPLVKFNEIRRNMDSKAGPHSMADDDDKTDGQSMSGDSTSTDTEPEDDYDYRGEAGVFRLRGGASHQQTNRNLAEELDYITPAGIARPDGSHRTNVTLHLQLGENCLYDVIISSNSRVRISLVHLPLSNSIAVQISNPER